MTKWDKYLMFCIICISLFSIYYTKNIAFNSDTVYVNIEIDGENYKKISLGPNTEGNIIKIETEYGYNVIEIGKNRVRVIDANCHDKLDVKQGWISNPGEVIVCLPHRLVIELESKDIIDDDLDYISY